MKMLIPHSLHPVLPHSIVFSAGEGQFVFPDIAAALSDFAFIGSIRLIVIITVILFVTVIIFINHLTIHVF